MSPGKFTTFSHISVLHSQIGHIVSCSVLLSPRPHYQGGNLTKVNSITWLCLHLTFLLITPNPVISPVALDASAAINWVLLPTDFKLSSINCNYQQLIVPALNFHFTTGKSMCGLIYLSFQPHSLTFAVQLSVTLAIRSVQLSYPWYAMCQHLPHTLPYWENKQ